MLATSEHALRSAPAFEGFGLLCFRLWHAFKKSIKRLSRSRALLLSISFASAVIFLRYNYWRHGFTAARRGNEATVGTIFSGPMFRRNVIQFRPQDVFLLYTKTPKTSSTFASSMIAGAYVSAGLPVANTMGNFNSRAKYAAVHHQMGVTPAKLRSVEQENGRPVLLVLSTRDGTTALQSAAIAAQQYDETKNRTFDCSLMKNPDKYARRYWDHIQAGLDGAVPWAVIRHEHVEEDTCCVLAALGLECQPDMATAHVSKSDLDFGHCVLPEVNASDARRIDEWNKRLMDTRTLTDCSGS